jgi:uncharacterized protein
MHHPLAAISATSLIWWLGWALLAALALQCLALLFSGLRRAAHERRRRAAELARLELEIEVARLRIRTVEQERAAWNGIRKFTVAEKTAECLDTFSYVLKPHDGRPLPGFKPGQYATFQLAIPGLTKPIIRCYSLSDCARPDHYRVTIKRCPPPSGSNHPPGIGSSFFCDSVKPGDILDVKAPAGHFFLDMEKDHPVVLISGGVGITPMIAMAHALIAAGSKREIWFFFGARNRSEHMLRTETLALKEKYPNCHLHICYSKPSQDDVLGRDYQHEGRVTVELMKKLLPSQNFHYYLCGPGAFMESITDDLRAWGVPDAWVHFEAFGPASVKKAAKPAMKEALTAEPFKGGAAASVAFAKTGQTVFWSTDAPTVLDMAESLGIRIEAGCRAGNCGACLVAIKSGEVEYIGGHGAEPEAGSCLACICKPKGTLVVDA